MKNNKVSTGNSRVSRTLVRIYIYILFANSPRTTLDCQLSEFRPGRAPAELRGIERISPAKLRAKSLLLAGSSLARGRNNFQRSSSLRCASIVLYLLLFASLRTPRQVLAAVYRISSFILFFFRKISESARSSRSGTVGRLLK